MGVETEELVSPDCHLPKDGDVCMKCYFEMILRRQAVFSSISVPSPCGENHAWQECFAVLS